MAQFQRRAGTALPQSLTMTTGGKLHLKLVPAKGEKIPIVIATTAPEVVRAGAFRDHAGANFTTFTLDAFKLGNASLRAGPDADKPLAGPIAISVVARIALPDETTTQGMFVRLFLAECWTPSMKGYAAADAETAMKWMKLVVQNRLARKSAAVGSAGAKTLLDVVRAAHQFDGFEQYPVLSPGIGEHLRRYVEIANDDSHRERDGYREFIETAVRVANADVADPALTDLLFWRTTGTGKPAPAAVQYKELMGNTYYTLAP